VASIVAFDASGNLVGDGDIKAQTRQVLENIKELVFAAGGSLSDVVYLTDFANYAGMNEVYHEYFAEAPPARATVKVELFDPPPPRGDRCRRGVVVARLLPLFVEPRFHSCNRFADGGSLSSLQWLLERLGKAAPPAHTRRACKFVSQNGHSNSLPITPALRDSRPWPKRQSCAEVPPRAASRCKTLARITS
jgi:endoribonuclease L-PSP